MLIHVASFACYCIMYDAEANRTGYGCIMQPFLDGLQEQGGRFAQTDDKRKGCSQDVYKDTQSGHTWQPIHFHGVPASPSFTAPLLASARPAHQTLPSPRTRRPPRLRSCCAAARAASAGRRRHPPGCLPRASKLSAPPQLNGRVWDTLAAMWHAVEPYFEESCLVAVGTQ
jgi:hypothetical protein